MSLITLMNPGWYYRRIPFGGGGDGNLTAATVARGSIYRRNFNDISTFLDSASKHDAYKRAAVDTTSVSATFNHGYTYKRILSDLHTLNAVITRYGYHGRTVTSNLNNLSSNVFRLQNFARFPFDTSTHGDGVSRVDSFRRNISDSVNTGATLGRILAFPRNLIQTETTSATPHTSLVAVRSIQDVLTTVDNVKRQIAYARTLQETLNVVQFMMSQQFHRVRNVSDTILTTDYVTRLCHYFRYIPNGSGGGSTTTFSDSLSHGVVMPRHLTDSFTFFSTCVAKQDVARYIMDTFTVVDNVNLNDLASRIFLEYLNFFSASVSGQQVTSRNITDNINLLSANLSAYRAYNRSTTDSTTISFSVARKLTLPRHNVDDLPIDVELTTSQILNRLQAEHFSTSALATASRLLDRTVSENLNFISDFLIRNTNVYRSSEETFATLDILTRKKEAVRNFSESLTYHLTAINRVGFHPRGNSEFQTYNSHVQSNNLFVRNVTNPYITFSDSLINKQHFVRRVNAILSTTPTLKIVQTVFRRSAEFFTTTPTVTNNQHFIRYMSSVTSLTAAAKALQNINRVASDTTNFTFNLNQLQHVIRTFADSLPTVDALYRRTNVHRTANDTSHHTDMLISHLLAVRSANEYYLTTAIASYLKLLQRHLSDTSNFSDNMTRVFAFNKHFIVSLNQFSDILTRVVAHRAHLSDTLTTLNNVNSVLHAVRTINDTLNVFSDSTIRSTTGSRNFTQSNLTNPTISRNTNLYRIEVESHLTSASLAKFVQNNRFAQDTFGFVDNFIRVTQVNRYNTDITSTNASLTRHANVSRILADTSFISDATYKLVSYKRNFADSLPMSASQNRSSNVTRSNTDSSYMSDSTNRQTVLSRFFSFISNFTDNSIRNTNVNRSETDNINTFTDTLHRNQNQVYRNTSDSFNTTDSLINQNLFRRLFAENYTTQDSLTLAQNIMRRFSDTLHFSDYGATPSSHNYEHRFLNEIFSFSDSLISNQTLYRNPPPELLTGRNTLDAKKAFARSVADIFNVSSNLNSSTFFNRQVFDTSNMFDGMTIEQAVNRFSSVNFSTLDAFSIFVSYIRNLSEIFNTTDTFNRSTTISRSFVDTYFTSETHIKQVNYLRFETENIDTTDSMQRETDIIRSTSSLLNTNASFIRSTNVKRNFSHNLNTSASFVRQTVVSRSFVNNNLTQDVFKKIAYVSRDSEDTFDTSIALANFQNFVRTLTDIFDNTDVVAKTIFNYRQQNDTLETVDEVDRIKHAVSSMSDNLGIFSDELQNNSMFVRNLQDTFNIADNVARTLGNLRYFVENFQTIDEMTRQVQYFNFVEDILSTADSIIAYKNAIRNLDDNLEFASYILDRSVQNYRNPSDTFNLDDEILSAIIHNFFASFNEMLETTDEANYHLTRQALVESILHTADLLSRTVKLERNPEEELLESDEVKAERKRLRDELRAHYRLYERVQFTYNGTMCQGNIIQLIDGPVNKLVIEVDVCDNYNALNNSFANRVVVDEDHNDLRPVSPPSWE